MKYSIEKVAALIGARRFGETECDVQWVLTDSRSLCFAESTLFFAIKTERNDGQKYVDELYQRGVRGFVVQQLPKDWQTAYPDANFLKVDNSLLALQRLAERHRDEFSIPIVGITGSNGKTVVKEWLHQILSPSMVVTRSPKSYNSQVGVPLSVWLLDERTQVGLFEAGISMPGEMDALRDIIQPTIGVLTYIGGAHQENFETVEQKCREKWKLFKDAKTIVVNIDNSLVAKMVEEGGKKRKVIACSRIDPKADMFVKRVEKHDNHTNITYAFQGQEGHFDIPFIDDASVENAVLCAAVALHLGITQTTLSQRMPSLEPVAMRLEVKEGRHGCTLINDSYNSDINSLGIALDFMNRRPDHKGRKRTLVLSDIYQSGMPPQMLYKTVSDMAKSRGVERFIGIGPEITAHAGLVDIDDKAFFKNTEDFLESNLFSNLHDEVILLKGARNFNFDRLTDMLVQKVHETILEVNLNALVANLNYYRSFLKPTTKIVCMIKADGYGAGAVEIAKTLQDQRVDYLAVAVADEGVSLRKNGITGNIMVMNPEMSSFKTLFEYDLEPEVYSFRLLDALIHAASKEGIAGYPVHVKLDTGMHRLGFDPVKDIELLLEKLKGQSAVMPRSVFSHFVGSDSDDFDNFSLIQYQRFIEASNKLQQAFSHKIIRHIDNSAGIEHFPERQLDMCRLGLGLYGISSRDNKILNNVSTLKTTILQMRNVPKEETVGYSRKGILTKDSVIAAIPIGYADGLNRGLGRGKCYCLVNGKKAPYVGNICMDVAMIDVTGINCQEGDTVEIFGDHLPVTLLSNTLGTIPYEILTAVSNRVKRVYFQD
ncbi:MAG: bifunctional UDP-N-acetylmuramoyl-tripeptide:D-alanyl-D-alanine ligase/alanine racemase [Prevotella sp.]|nr:bifunctional UDP-N-acetylmuramoyl-tripeptide:D-alanyl-D-alanine ligase/alanine racemase [Prevotella sp.]